MNKYIINKFFEDFTNHKKKNNKAAVFSHRPLPKILEYRVLKWDLESKGI